MAWRARSRASMSSTAPVSATVPVPPMLVVLLTMAEEHKDPSVAKFLLDGAGGGREALLPNAVGMEEVRSRLLKKCCRVLACRACPSERSTRAATVCEP